MVKLLLVRHGKSLRNIDNIFTGWTDIDLAPQGVKEAQNAGLIIKDSGINIDICFSSYPKRAIKTAWIMLENADMMNIDCLTSWKLNERNYGAWQGQNKADIKNEVGDDEFLKIRRGFSKPPPALTLTDKRHPRFDKKYKNLNASLLPVSESLKDTRERVIQYFFEQIAPQLVQNKTVLVSAHGNSIRAIISHIENIVPKDISKVEVQTGAINSYEFYSNLNLKKKTQLN